MTLTSSTLETDEDEVTKRGDWPGREVLPETFVMSVGAVRWCEMELV